MCEYVKTRCDGKPLYYLTELPSDAVPITHIKGIAGGIHKGLYYNPKSREIHRKQIYPVDGVFNYRVVDDEYIALLSGKVVPISHLCQSCEKLYNK